MLFFFFFCLVFVQAERDMRHRIDMAFKSFAEKVQQMGHIEFDTPFRDLGWEFRRNFCLEGQVARNVTHQCIVQEHWVMERKGERFFFFFFFFFYKPVLISVALFCLMFFFVVVSVFRFYGVPFRSSVFMVPTTHCLVHLVEHPVTCITLDEVELVHFERVSVSCHTFEIRTSVFLKWLPCASPVVPTEIRNGTWQPFYSCLAFFGTTLIFRSLPCDYGQCDRL